MMDDDATVAAVFRAALTLGIATPADLVPWADGQIMARDRPVAWIIDLALSAAWAVDRVNNVLADVAVGADAGRVSRLLVGLIDGVDGWTAAAACRAPSWLWIVTANTNNFTIGLDAVTYADELILGLTDFPDHPRTPAVQAGLMELLAELVRRHADPAARAWLPAVRVRFDGDGVHGSA